MSPAPAPVSRRWMSTNIDPVIVGAVFVYNLPVQGVPTSAGSLAALALPVGLCAPYLLRRRRPGFAFAAIAATAYLQLAVGVGLLVADVMLAPALYNLASRTPPRRSTPALALTLGWVALATIPGLGANDLSIGDVAVLMLLAVTAWLLGLLTTSRRAYVESLRARADQLERERETQAQLAAAAERTRIARELHDIVSHSLSAITLLSDGAATMVHTQPEQARATMLTVRDTSREAMTEMRSMLTVLRADADATDHAPQPGLNDLDDLVRQAADTGLPARLTLAPDLPPLPPAVQLLAYRVAQEALTNVRKHAGPVREVTVDVRPTGSDVEIRVRDDGNGSLDPADDPDGTGFGLLGMRERVAAHGGTLHTGPAQPRGYEVLAVLPVGGAR